MASFHTYFVGAEDEVSPHMAPLRECLPVERVSASRVVDVAQPGDVVLFFSEHFQRFRTALRRLRERQIASLYLIDGILEWRNAWDNLPDEPACPWTMRPCLAHQVACIGPSQWRLLSSWGNRDRLHVVGVPRFESLLRSRPSLSESIERHESTTTRRVLVMTAKCPGFTPEQRSTTGRSLRDLRDFLGGESAVQGSAKGAGAWQVTWRLSQGLADELQVSNGLESFSGGDLYAQIRNADVVVTGPSTAMVEAMLLGKPVVLLDYHHTPQWVPGAWQINRAEDIEPVMRGLFSAAVGDRAMTRRRWAWQEHVLEDTLRCQVGASARLVSLIEAMHERSVECHEQGTSLEFSSEFPCEVSRRWLGLASEEWLGESEVFSHRLLYPSFCEFEGNDDLQLRAELAQSRRDVAHLQKRLDEAHAVFDEIQRHPIAGPVVRVRQRLMDWFQRRRRRGQVIHATKSP